MLIPEEFCDSSWHEDLFIHGVALSRFASAARPLIAEHAAAATVLMIPRYRSS